MEGYPTGTKSNFFRFEKPGGFKTVIGTTSDRKEKIECEEGEDFCFINVIEDKVVLK